MILENAIEYNTEVEWLDARRRCVTASDAAAILGVSKYKTALQVYNEKKQPTEKKYIDLFWWGHRLEQPTADFFTRKTGIELFDAGDFTMFYNKETPWLKSTLDRYTADKIPVELKHITTGISVEQWESEPPIDNEIQLQIQMYCTGAQRGYLVGSGFRYAMLGIIEIERNDKFLNYAVTRLKDFYERSILGDEIPTPNTNKDKSEIQKAFGISDGSTIELGDAELTLANELEQCRDDIKELKEKKETAETLLKFKLGRSSFGRLPDGTFLTNKEDKRGKRRLRRTRRF